jgi:hypothetical protein
MKLYINIALLTFFLASCSTSRMASSSYDDVYFIPSDDIQIVQYEPQPAPQKYTPLTNSEDYGNSGELLYGEEPIATEDYSDTGEEDDYETKLRRFRDEDFEYSYENGYADGYSRAFGNNNYYRNTYTNSWYGYDSWNYDPWVYTSYNYYSWGRPYRFNRGWGTGYNSYNGWYGGYSWGNTGCNNYYYYGTNWGHHNSGYSYGSYRNSYCGYGNYGYSHNYYSSRNYIKYSSNHLSTGNNHYQGSQRFTKAANSPRQRVDNNSTSGNTYGSTGGRRPGGERFSITGSMPEKKPTNTGNSRVTNPGFRPTTRDIGVRSNTIPQANRSVKGNQQGEEENRDKSGYQRELGINQNPSTRENVTRSQDPNRKSTPISAPSRSVTPNAEKPLYTNTQPSSSRPAASSPSRSSSPSVAPSSSRSSASSPSRSSSYSSTPSSSRPAASSPSRSSSYSSTPSSSRPAASSPSRSSSPSVAPSSSRSSVSSPSRSSSPSTSSSSSAGGQRR